MRSRDGRTLALVLALVLMASATAAVAALLVSAKRVWANRDAPASSVRAAEVSLSGDPIPAEADVFRTQPGDLAIDPMPGGRRGAHPRTLATWRGLRLYPGAPPRIPHGLTPEETLRGGCKTCHERGGYSQRFGAYVPVTPHPEMGACLQCHVGDARLLPTPLPGTDPSARCRQCHSAGGMLSKDSALNWKPMPWPELAGVSGGHSPPPIPHGLEMRGNCLACHSAPSGVKEIRTSHPERANCRQCHVEGSRDADEFVRPARETNQRTAGVP
jgi:nitrate reductase (cytochrome), electron transfer subunit